MSGNDCDPTCVGVQPKTRLRHEFKRYLRQYGMFNTNPSQLDVIAHTLSEMAAMEYDEEE